MRIAHGALQPMSKSPTDCVTCPFRETGPVAGHKDETLRRFSQSLVRYRLKGNERRKAIFSEGEPQDGLILLCGGVVKLTKWAADDQEVILDVLTPCAVLSSPSDIGEVHKYSGVGIGDDIEIGVLRAGSFHALCDKLSEIQTSFFHFSSLLLAQLRERLSRCRAPVADRLMTGLLLLRSRCSGNREGPFKLPLSFTELAQFAHTTPETVSRTFRRLQKQGLLSISRKGIVSIHESGTPKPNR